MEAFGTCEALKKNDMHLAYIISSEKVIEHCEKENVEENELKEKRANDEIRFSTYWDYLRAGSSYTFPYFSLVHVASSPSPFLVRMTIGSPFGSIQNESISNKWTPTWGYTSTRSLLDFFLSFPLSDVFNLRPFVLDLQSNCMIKC